MTIYTPDGETNEKERLLACLMDWTTERTIILAMRAAGRLDYIGLTKLAAMVKATQEDNGLVGTKVPGDVPILSERMLVCSVLGFLDDNEVFGRVARYVAVAYGDSLERVNGENMLQAARRECRELKEHLVRTHKIHRDEIPRFLAAPHELEMLAVAKAAALFSNPAMKYDPTNPPEWVAQYAASDARLEPETIEWLRGLPEELRELAVKFPPLSLVRSPEVRLCPCPGELAFVVDYAMEDGQPCVVVTAHLAQEDTKAAGCRADWLELVACRGGMTTLAVEAVLAEVKA